jgi:HEAT repeat protein
MSMLLRRSMAFAVVAGLGLSLACLKRSPEAQVPGLIADLKNPDPTVSGKANLELIRLGEPAVPGLVEMLKSDDVRIRTLAVTAFWGLGAKGHAAASDLAATLADPVDSVRLGAAMALDNMGPPAREAVPALVRALKDRDARVRQWSAKALGSIGPAAEKAVPALVQAARSEGIRPAAEEAIRKIRGLREGQPILEPIPEQ